MAKGIKSSPIRGRDGGQSGGKPIKGGAGGHRAPDVTVLSHPSNTQGHTPHSGASIKDSPVDGKD